MSVAEKAFDLAYTQLRSQKEDLRSLRNQASFCAAVSGLVASVFVALLARSSSPTKTDLEPWIFGFSVAEALVLFLFSASIASAALAVIGWRSCKFDINPDVMLHASKYDRPLSDMYESLAKAAVANFHENEAVLDDAKQKLVLSLVFACAQIPAWIVLIAQEA